jgi:hypothetical protein
MSWLDLIFPPGVVDRECRPFELGWLLYAWHRDERHLAGVDAAEATGALRDPAMS